MRRFGYTLLFLFWTLCCPSISYASNSSIFSVPLSDQSLVYLGIIFGPMGSLPLSGGNSLLGQMFLVLTSTVLTIGVGMVAINSVISVMNTASEGEAMGHKWSSVWVPAKSLGGLILLLPTENGYAKIQVFIMWLIINSIGAANTLWAVVLHSYESGVSMSSPAPQSSNVTELSKQLFTSLTCMEYFNTQLPPTDTPTVWEPISIFIKINNSGSTSLAFGQPNLVNQPSICGQFDSVDFAALARDLGAPIPNADQFTQTQRAGLWTMIKTIQPGVDAVMTPGFSTNLPKINVITQAGNSFNELLATLQGPSAAVSSLVNGAVADGWILAGAYYYKLVSAQSAPSPATIMPKYTKPNLGITSFATAEGNDHLANINTYVNTYISKMNAQNVQPNQSLGLTPSNTGSVGQEYIQKMMGPLMSAVTDFTKYLSTNAGDPLVSAATVGTNIMMTCEIVWMAMVLMVFALAIPMNIMAVCQGPGIGQAFNTLVDMITPALMGVLIMLWTGGVTLGIYVPLVPYLVFTFASIGWMFEVIEGIVAAPLVALMLLVPSEDEWGKSSHSFLMYFSILLRPSLMILGFVAASKFLSIFVKFLNFGFAGTTKQLTGVGFFSSIVIVTIYAGIFIAVVHESFSLIYVLPDKVMRWIGGEGGSIGGEAEMLGEAKQASDSAAESTQGAIKGVSSGAGQMNQQAKKKGKSKQAALQKK